jgi:hypothetical protein
MIYTWKCGLEAAVIMGWLEKNVLDPLESSTARQVLSSRTCKLNSVQIVRRLELHQSICTFMSRLLYPLLIPPQGQFNRRVVKNFCNDDVAKHRRVALGLCCQIGDFKHFSINRTVHATP